MMKTEFFAVSLAMFCLAIPGTGRAQQEAPTAAADIKPLLIGAAVSDVSPRGTDGTTSDLKAAEARKPTVLSGTLVLPAPRREGGKPLLSALAARRSSREFSERPIPTQLLSDLLWAAFGVNRPESGNRTAPSSYNWQDITLYVFTPEGVWTYDASNHALVPVKSGDQRKLAGLQSYVWEAPLSLVYVSDQTLMRQGDEDFPDDYKTLISGIDAGHISQNVYLFCASEGLGAVARASVDAKAFADAFSLPAGHKVVLGQTIGFVAEAPSRSGN